MFYNARYYDPGIGRFTQVDTIVPNMFNPQSLNRYAYVRNNPVRYTDPSGFKPCGGVGEQDCAPAPKWDKPDPDERPFKDHVLILVCGINTYCGENGKIPELYGNQRPFEKVATQFLERGGKVVYVPTGDDPPVEEMVNRIGKIIDMNSDAAGFFLVGHSRGANAVVVAANKLTTSKILAVVLLDPDLADLNFVNLFKGKIFRPDTQVTGNIVVKKYPTFIGTATSDESSLPMVKPKAGGQYQFEKGVSAHHWLAVDEKVADDIIQFLLKYVR